MAAKAQKLVADSTAKKVRGVPFRRGAEWRGNAEGRPKGSRNKLDEAFVEALYKDFKASGVAAIRACRTKKPEVYLSVIAKVLPKQVDVKADQSVADLADGLHAVAEFLSGFAEEAGGADHAGALSDRSVLSSGLRSKAN